MVREGVRGGKMMQLEMGNKFDERRKGWAAVLTTMSIFGDWTTAALVCAYTYYL